MKLRRGMINLVAGLVVFIIVPFNNPSEPLYPLFGLLVASLNLATGLELYLL